MTAPRVSSAPAQIMKSFKKGDRINRCTAVILGAGGDLMRRKLMPAIYSLAEQKLLAETFTLVGVGCDAMDDDAFAKTMRDALEISDEICEVDPDTWAWF